VKEKERDKHTKPNAAKGSGKVNVIKLSRIINNNKTNFVTSNKK